MPTNKKGGRFSIENYYYSMKKINMWFANCAARMVIAKDAVVERMQDRKGDPASGFLIGLLISVVGLFIIISALKKFFPDLIETLFGKLKDEISGLSNYNPFPGTGG